LPSVVDGNAYAQEAQWNNLPVDDFEVDQFDFDPEVFHEMYAECPVINQAQDLDAHFFRNVNVTDLSDDLVQRIRVFFQRQIVCTTNLTELKKVLEDVCLEKKELIKALSLISEPSPKTVAQLKEELKSKQTSQSRELLLALVVNHAMSILQHTRPEVLNQYCNQMQCCEDFGYLWQDVPGEDDLAFISKCMGVFHVVHNELQLDCCSGMGKKGLVITAAVMIADSSRTYTNGGSQAKCIQILEGMFHRITGYTVKARGTKRNADDMSV
jgi:hypothetical protein